MKGNNSHFSATPDAIDSFLITHQYLFPHILKPVIFFTQLPKAA